eukprot:5199439-Heterocapsa_arctica.AAC.1
MRSARASYRRHDNARYYICWGRCARPQLERHTRRHDHARYGICWGRCAGPQLDRHTLQELLTPPIGRVGARSCRLET